MTLVVGWGSGPGPRRAEKTRSKKLSAEPVAQREHRERRLGRLAALVLLVGPGARERLHLLLDSQATVADRHPVHRPRQNRKSVVYGTRVPDRVQLGGLRILKK